MSKRILAYGNPVFDIILTPDIVREDRVLSGCSTNACLAARKLGEEATLIGTVGPDFNDRLASDLERWDIQAKLFPSKESGGFRLVYDHKGDRTLSVLGVADPIPAEADGFAGADFILLGPILGEIPVELVRQLRSYTSTPMILDPQGLLRVRRPGEGIVHERTEAFEQIAPFCTVIKANELETRVITGLEPRRDPEMAVRGLHEWGAEISIVTLAEAGSIIYDGEKVYPIPPYRTHAIDPTGAGDTYAAGFMVRYLERPDDLTQVGCFASAVASVMVENSGPQFPLTRAEADRRAEALLRGPLEIALG